MKLLLISNDIHLWHRDYFLLYTIWRDAQGIEFVTFFQNKTVRKKYAVRCCSASSNKTMCNR